MSGFSVSNDDAHLIRSNLWTPEIKEQFLDELMAQKYVRWLSDFPDGTTYNMPSVGQMETRDYVEGAPVQYTSMDTGNFTLTVDKYKESGTFITNQMKQDSFWMNELVASFVPREHRAIMKALEVDILTKPNAAQTASALNTINGAAHRFVGSGTSAVITPKDFARAKYGLDKANVPPTARVAIVDPSVEFTLSTLTNLQNVSNNPRWEGIVKTGMSTGMRFLTNIYGFDVYMSQNLPVITSETVDSVASGANAVANYFFSAAADAAPWVGVLRQPPKVDSKYNQDFQREEYVTTARWGVKYFREENLVTVITATDQVS